MNAIGGRDRQRKPAVRVTVDWGDVRSGCVCELRQRGYDVFGMRGSISFIGWRRMVVRSFIALNISHKVNASRVDRDAVLSNGCRSSTAVRGAQSWESVWDGLLMGSRRSILDANFSNHCGKPPKRGAVLVFSAGNVPLNLIFFVRVSLLMRWVVISFCLFGSIVSLRLIVSVKHFYL